MAPARKKPRLEGPEAALLAPEPFEDLPDSTWDDLGALAAASASPEPEKPKRLEAEESDEDDYGDLLNLDDAVAASEEPGPFSGEDISALLSAASKKGAQPASTSHASTSASNGVSNATAPDAVAAQAIENLQAMLAGAAAEAEEDELLSEDEILDEELESDDEPLALRAGFPPQATCSTCSDHFANNDELSQHIYTHIKASSFVCEGCNKPFSRADALKRHTLGATATDACQKASLEPNMNPDTFIELEHARLLEESIGLSAVRKRAGPATGSAPMSKKKRAKVRQTAREQQRQADMEAERETLKPVYAAIKAAHIARALEKVVEAGLDVREVFRQLAITGEELAMLHFVFNEVVMRQDEFLDAVIKSKLKAKKEAKRARSVSKTEDKPATDSAPAVPATEPAPTDLATKAPQTENAMQTETPAVEAQL